MILLEMLTGQRAWMGLHYGQIIRQVGEGEQGSRADVIGIVWNDWLCRSTASSALPPASSAPPADDAPSHPLHPLILLQPPSCLPADCRPPACALRRQPANVHSG